MTKLESNRITDLELELYEMTLVANAAEEEIVRLRAVLERIAALYDLGSRERQTVTLGKIIEWCRDALL